MKLKSLNKNIKKFGFEEELEYTNATFNGHQLGIAVCIKNNQTGETEQNLLSQSLGNDETRDFLLMQLLLDKSILLIENNIVQPDKDTKELIPKTIYYLPYYVEDHSVMQPTINYKNIEPIGNKIYDIKVEVLFVEDSLNRYITVPLKTKHTSIVDLINDLFIDTNKEEFEKIGISWQDEGYALDFYNQAGERFDLIFEDATRLKDSIVSMRLIDISCCTEVGDKNEKTKSS